MKQMASRPKPEVVSDKNTVLGIENIKQIGAYLFYSLKLNGCIWYNVM